LTTLYLVRHGETRWNVEGRYQGQLDPPLNERGEAQARATARELAAVGVEAIYSSDLARAHQTAQALAELVGLPVVTDSRLREINQGEWQGILIGDIRSQWPEDIARWEQQPWECCPPGGESLQEIQARIQEAIDEIVRRRPDGTVAVFTHKLPIALLKIRYRGDDPATLWSLLPANATWERFEIQPQREGTPGTPSG
jgi:broad specificity phosphatase PhoE